MILSSRKIVECMCRRIHDTWRCHDVYDACTFWVSWSNSLHKHDGIIHLGPITCDLKTESKWFSSFCLHYSNKRNVQHPIQQWIFFSVFGCTSYPCSSLPFLSFHFWCFFSVDFSVAQREKKGHHNIASFATFVNSLPLAAQCSLICLYHSIGSIKLSFSLRSVDFKQFSISYFFFFLQIDYQTNRANSGENYNPNPFIQLWSIKWFTINKIFSIHTVTHLQKFNILLDINARILLSSIQPSHNNHEHKQWFSFK